MMNLFGIEKTYTHNIIKIFGIKISFKNKISCKKSLLYIGGKNNKVYIIKNGRKEEIKNKIPGLDIFIDGNNNVIEIYMPSHFENARIRVSSHNSYIRIEETPKFMFLVNCWGGENQKFVFGKNSDCSGHSVCHLVDNNASCVIGEDCMFAGEVTIWTSDAHAIYDINSLDIINTITSPVKIGNHCWIGQGATLTKNCQLQNNTVVGTHSVVTKRFEEKNIIVAGNPATIIKRNCNWDRKSIFNYQLTRKLGENNNDKNINNLTHI